MSQFDMFGEPITPPAAQSAAPPRKPRAKRTAPVDASEEAAPSDVVPMGEWVPAPMPAAPTAAPSAAPPAAAHFAATPTAAPFAVTPTETPAAVPSVTPPRRKPEPEVLPVESESALLDLAARLPAGLRLGTSSWTFPGWAGLVYRDTASETVLARKGLAAYARHPLLRSVGIDRTFYAPMAAEEMEPLAAAVPEDFRFLVKAHAALTTPFDQWKRMPYAGRVPVDRFFDAGYAADRVIAPVLEGLGARAGVILFQFPPLGPPYARTALRFADHLSRFLEALPALPVDAQGRGPRYAVDIRNREFLGPAYAATLGARGVVHCLNVHPRMPSPAAQSRLILDGHAIAGINARPPLTVVRWMLHPAREYVAAREEFAPFDQLAAPDVDSRSAVAEEVAAALARQDEVIVIANNKAEGSAPLTLRQLAAALVARTEPA